MSCRPDILRAVPSRPGPMAKYRAKIGLDYLTQYIEGDYVQNGLSITWMNIYELSYGFYSKTIIFFMGSEHQ